MMDLLYTFLAGLVTFSLVVGGYLLVDRKQHSRNRDIIQQVRSILRGDYVP